MLASGCSWSKNHLNGEAWGKAANPIQPHHWGSLALLATTPFFHHNDDRLSRDLASRQPYAGKEGTRKGDLVMGLLGASPLITAAIAAGSDDPSHKSMEILEVVAEATLLNIMITDILKRTVLRKRPNNNSGRGGRANASNASFPSGHVTTAMTGAALTGRWLREQNPWFGLIELALYGGVGYVGITRMENDKHYPSDVVGSMAIAHYVATTVWDAHFGVKEKEEGLFSKIRKHSLPVPMGDGAGILFHFEF